MNVKLPLTGLKTASAAALLGVAAGAAAQVEHLEWLETPTAPKALAWARQQTVMTNAELSKTALFQPILSELRSALKIGEPLAEVAVLGPRALRLQRDVAHPHGRLQVADRSNDGAPLSWKTVLDMDELRRTEGKAYDLQFSLLAGLAKSCLAPAYRYCLLSLAPNGGDEAELREFDLVTGKFVRGGFALPATRNQFTWLDRDRVLIAHALGDSPRTSANWAAAVRMWHRGKPVATAPIIYQAQPSDSLVLVDRIGEGRGALGLISRVIDYATVELLTVLPSGALAPVALPKKLKLAGALATTQRHLFVQLTEPAEIQGKQYPAESVLSYDTAAATPAASRVQAVSLPRDGEFVDLSFGNAVAGLASELVFTVKRGLRKTVQIASPSADGWKLRDVFTTTAGTTVSFDSSDAGKRDVVLRTQGYLVPAELRLMRAGELKPAFASEPAVFDASRMLVESRQVRSKDGTMIDYDLIRPRNIEPGRSTPTLMTGYGAFGVTISPGYFSPFIGGKSAQLWFARGGALAIPAIRGGGERGAQWHHAALREKRQNSYDDFIAAAEDLVQRGFVRPAQMGIFGSSNGGLLAATIGLQRPDLFGAVVSDAPVLDMLRYTKMGIGGGLTNEYGNPEDPAMAKVLRSYSPLHIAKKDVPYPPFLVTIATSDNRVGPGHSRKMVARLEELGSKAYLYEDADGGHGVSDPLMRPELMALRMTFLINTLMTPRP